MSAWRPDVPCSIDDGSGGSTFPLGNVEPVAGFPEPWVSCTVALERIELGGLGFSEFGPIIEISSECDVR